MTTKENQLEEFSRESFKLLTKLFSIDNPKEPSLDIKPVDQRIEDAEKKIKERIPEYAELYDAFIYIFSGDSSELKMPIELIAERVENEVVLEYMTASYEAKTHTIHVATYPSIGSLARYCKHFGVLADGDLKKLQRDYSDSLFEIIGGEMSHACRASAIGYAYTNGYADKLSLTYNKQMGIGLIRADLIKSGNKDGLRKEIRETKLKPLCDIDVAEFFEAVGINELANNVSAPYRFTPTHTFESGLETLRELKILSQSYFESPKISDTDVSTAAILNEMYQHLPSIPALGIYNNPNMREEFRKNHLSQVIYQSPEQIFKTFIFPVLQDVFFSLG